MLLRLRLLLGSLVGSVLLFSLLTCDTLIHYRLRWQSRAAASGAQA